MSFLGTSAPSIAGLIIGNLVDWEIKLALVDLLLVLL
jgi:hypothetical protein